MRSSDRSYANKIRKKMPLSLEEADRISYTDALFILISIAFGVGYVDVISSGVENKKSIYYTQIANFFVGCLSCYILS